MHTLSIQYDDIDVMGLYLDAEDRSNPLAATMFVGKCDVYSALCLEMQPRLETMALGDIGHELTLVSYRHAFMRCIFHDQNAVPIPQAQLIRTRIYPVLCKSNLA